MRELPIVALQTTLSLADTEAPQPIYILGGVEAPTIPGTTGDWESAQPLSEPKPRGSYAKLGGCLADGEYVRLCKHAHFLTL
jgi:hypothetical protein